MDDLTIFIFLPIALLSPGEHSPTNKLKTLDYAGDGHHLEKKVLPLYMYNCTFFFFLAGVNHFAPDAHAAVGYHS